MAACELKSGERFRKIKKHKRRVEDRLGYSKVVNKVFKGNPLDLIPSIYLRFGCLGIAIVLLLGWQLIHAHEIG